jgi:hypothetical protein
MNQFNANDAGHYPVKINGKEYKYQLRSVIHYTGNGKSGHYTFRTVENGHCLELDDMSQSKESISGLTMQGAQMAVLEQVN